jgi:hypothetical protein
MSSQASSAESSPSPQTDAGVPVLSLLLSTAAVLDSAAAPELPLLEPSADVVVPSPEPVGIVGAIELEPTFVVESPPVVSHEGSSQMTCGPSLKHAEPRNTTAAIPLPSYRRIARE